MFKLLKKIEFKDEENKMKSIADTKIALEYYNSNKSNNLNFLLSKRFNWMNNFIKDSDSGIEVGSGIGFSKNYIKNKNFKISDISSDDHLDFKGVDAQKTGLKSQNFDFVIASNMVHHIPYPIKFFREIHRILKKDGKLIIFEPYCSILLQLVTIIMRHEGFDFTVNPWDSKKPKSSEQDAWHGNIAVSNLIFDNKKKFEEELGQYFEIKYEKLTECLIFLNSGGVTSKTFSIPLNNFFIKIIDKVDDLLIKLMPGIFCLGRRLVLQKKN
ncbi:class I SAM-dependent methyltransferase [Pelagibacteraceae bacterium]|nr:class I SAM-dependent methyltransferase [Pelagibacteraceae bacterium]